MIDEFDAMVIKGRRNWPAVFAFSALVYGMLVLTVCLVVFRAGVEKSGDTARLGGPTLQITDGKEIWVGTYFPTEYRRLVNEGDRLTVGGLNEIFLVYLKRFGIRAEMMPNESPLPFSMPDQMNTLRNEARCQYDGTPPGADPVSDPVEEQ